ncbi:MAG: TIGR04211 family SH3 domain-containing protein [Thermodesulfobacteriota bacterium]
MKKICLVMICLVFSSKAVQAVSMYINDVVNVSMRIGPGLNQEVIQMIKSGQKVDVIEQTKDWTLVRLPNNKEGWVLSRYLSSEQPNSYLLQILKDEHQKLISRAETMQQQYASMKRDNEQLTAEIDKQKQKLLEIQMTCDSLRDERNLHLFLIGAGILLLGFFIGYSTKNNRRRSSLIS